MNTKKSIDSVWKQFQHFCDERKYILNKETTVSELALILKDFAFNMRRNDGEEFKEGVVKTLWNTVYYKSVLKKEKKCASSLSEQEIDKMCTIWDEMTPDGLQRKFFHIASYELAWRGLEACNCLLSYFEEEFDSYGNPTGRIAYNPIFSKTVQGGCQWLTEKRWLV